MRATKTASGVYLHYVDGYIQELGFDSERVFRNAGVDYPNDVTSNERVSLSQLAAVIEKAQLQTKAPDFALQLGKRIPLMAHGNLGVAMLACKDFCTLLRLSEKFSQLALSSVHLSVTDHENTMALQLRIETGYPVLDTAVIDAILGSLVETFRRLSDEDIHPKCVSLRMKKPNHYQHYEGLLRCPVEFGASENVLLFSKKQLSLPIQTADTIGGARLVEQCQEDLRKIEQSSPFITRITQIVSSHLASSPTVTFVAAEMELSERTLRRRLADEQLNFRGLIKGIRHQRACYLLRETDYRIEKITQELGYKETANFRRAFKEHEGVSPRTWRRLMQG